MRASEIMESEMSSQNVARLNRAEQSFQNGFETETARKDAMNDLGRIYEDGVREEVQKNLRPLYWATMSPDGAVLPGHQDKFDELRNLLDILPYGLSQVRDKHFAVVEKFGDIALLKKLVALRTEMKEAPLVPKKRDVEKAAKAAALAANTVIADATEPLKTAAIAKAKLEAEQFADLIKKRLESVRFNPYAIIPKVEELPREPRPTAHEISIKVEERKAADSRRRRYLMFLDQSTGYYRWSDDLVSRYVEMCMQGTALHYDGYVAKMNDKIKDPVSANFRWINDVWGHSELMVTLTDGTREVWKTQIIVNVSKLGKLFNQWPSRRVK